MVSDKRNLCFSLCNTPIPHRPLIPRIDTKDKYLDLWLNRTHFVKILTDLHSPVEFLQFVGLSGIRLKSFELFKTLATNSLIRRIVCD